MMLQNIRVAVRSLARTPAFTMAVVLTLALGIGANSAVFSAIDAVLLKPLPFPESERLVRIQQHNARVAEPGVAPVRLLDWARMNSTFQTITGYYTQDGAETSGELPERVKQAFVAPRFLEVWGAPPALGRDFTDAEFRFGGSFAAIISDRLWRRRFNADPAAIGKQLRFAQTSYTIVGVMPASFLSPDREVEMWIPVFMDAPYAQSRFNVWFTVVGRLKPGVVVEQASANLASVQAALGREFGAPDSDLTVSISSLKETQVGRAGQSLWLLFGAVSVLLLIACANITALLLARASRREHDVAVRYSLGAARGAVVLQFLTESFVLALAGAAVGLALAFAAIHGFRVLAFNFPRADEITLDLRIVLYTLGCAAATTLLCGIVPAVRGSRRDARSSLASASRTLVSSRNPIQWTLVGAQIALAVVLLAGAGLLLKSLLALGRVSPGFDVTNVLTFRLTGSWAEGDMRQRAERTLEFLETIPGIERATLGFTFPGAPAEYATELTVLEGRPGTEPRINAETRFVAAGYFDVMRIPLLAGKKCRERRDPAYIEALVNRSFAKAYFPGEDPIGRNLRLPNANATPVRIVGVVEDALEAGIDRAVAPVLYRCGVSAQPNAAFMVRTHNDPTAMVETLRRKLREFEPLRSVYDIKSLEERLSDAFAQNRLRTLLLAFFAATAVSLACIGLYGTLSYFVSVRRREIGLRLALGAVRSRIIGRFMARGVAVAAFGCLIGLTLTAAFTRVLSGLLFGVSPWDPATLTGVTALMLAAAAAASCLPSIRAARLEPMQVLRDE